MPRRRKASASATERSLNAVQASCSQAKREFPRTSRTGALTLIDVLIKRFKGYRWFNQRRITLSLEGSSCRGKTRDPERHVRFDRVSFVGMVFASRFPTFGLEIKLFFKSCSPTQETGSRASMLPLTLTGILMFCNASHALVSSGAYPRIRGTVPSKGSPEGR